MVNLGTQSFSLEEEEVKEEDCDLYEKKGEEMTVILPAQLLGQKFFSTQRFFSFFTAIFLISTLM